MTGGYDVHTHLIPPAILKAADNGAFSMRLEPDRLHICGHGVPLEPIQNAGKLAERIESDKLNAAIVSVPPPLFRPDLQSEARKDYAREINDGLFEGCAQHPGRLLPLAYLPAEDPEMAADIAASLSDDWTGVVMGTELGALNYSSPAYDVLWQTLSEQALTVFLHPGSSPDARLAEFYLSNLLGNPVETTIAVAHLVFANVMKRFPKLNIVLAHGGGCIAALAGRWQRGLDSRRPGVNADMSPPAEALRRFYVDTIVHSPAFLKNVMEVIGEDKIVLGSDWPFPMGARTAEDDIGHLDEALRRRIRKDNALAAFGIRLACRRD